MNDELVRKLFSIPGVVSVGWGFKNRDGLWLDQKCVIVGVEKKRSFIWPCHKIPAKIDSFETDVVEVGQIVSLVNRKINWRPAPGGVSIGHKAITAGTLGCLVRVTGQEGPFILSNNHVLANSNDANLGDPILQRAPADGGSLVDTIANLVKFETLDFGGGPNYVDCAIAKPVNQADVIPEILGIGEPIGYGEVQLGMGVQKSGRTTAVTIGTVQQVGVVVRVAYPGNREAMFHDQIFTGPMSQGGDSGSVLLDTSRKIVGLLFAGSVEITCHSPIKYAVEALNLDTGDSPPPDELRITAYYRFTDEADWTEIGRMRSAAFEYQLVCSIPGQGVCRLKCIAEEGGSIVGEAETGDFTIEPGSTIKLAWIYPQGGETIKEGEEIMLRVGIERE